mmetsp:Transcript_7202/g.18677  ORF Transcript_7202/g.18677 Transcript_7202/m.18677 type:complete len:98 (+) Transcript_7202:1203-1496(+)
MILCTHSCLKEATLCIPPYVLCPLLAYDVLAGVSHLYFVLSILPTSHDRSCFTLSVPPPYHFTRLICTVFLISQPVGKKLVNDGNTAQCHQLISACV